MTQLIGVYGASGFGREVMPVLRASCRNLESEIVFIDDCKPDPTNVAQPVLSWDQFLATDAAMKSVVIAIAKSDIRRKLYIKCEAAGIHLRNLIAYNAYIGDNVSVGPGCIMQPFTSITSDITIGRGFHANIYSYVAHDCIIGDFVTFAPRVMCNGNVHIGDGAYIGTGAVLRQGATGKPLVVGADAVVGMGAVVTKDVPPGATVVGNPARPLVR